MNTKSKSIKSINKVTKVQKVSELNENDVSILLGAEIEVETGERIKDQNWICNFH